jgi:hypothetical protein
MYAVASASHNPRKAIPPGPLVLRLVLLVLIGC